MGLFRRFRRDKDAATETEKPAGTEPDNPSEESTPVAPVSPNVPPATAPATAGPARIPPPLPDRPAESSASAPLSSEALTKCFVCGTPLDGQTCPTCRMTWVE
jgi:hypothetical protein